MTDETLNEIETRAKAATPGPWYVPIGHEDEVCAGDEAEGQLVGDVYHPPNAEFVAHAREDVPALVAEVRRLMRERDEARAHLAAVEKLLPREEYLSDKTLAENLAGWIAALRRDAKERSEFAAAETGHANRWAERAHAAEKRCKEIGDEAALAQKERDEARAEVERLKLTQVDWYDEGFAAGKGEKAEWSGAAFRRGAEAMREAAASCVGSDTALLQTYRSVLEGRIRALPVPEDK